MPALFSSLPLNFFSKKTLEVKFSELSFSSDAGLLLIRQIEENIKLCQGIANCLTDKREPAKIEHTLTQLITQRVYQIIAGYEDANDSNRLRQDPILKLVCGRIPLPEEELLASQPTISRLENSLNKQEVKAIRSFFLEQFIHSYSEAPDEIVLDIDGWDAETYGNQQLSLFHGYYGHSMYFPFLINEAKSGYPLVLELRAGNSHSGKGVVGLLRWLFWRLKKVWSKTKIILRGDGGFSLPEIVNLCERNEIGYVFGYISNSVLKGKISNLIEQARLQFIRTGEKARLFEDVYYAARTWKEPRRIIMKAEWLEKGANQRFVVTNLLNPAQELYDDIYVKRGAASEHRIKELKLGINAKRLSCHQFIANQFRLFLSQAAYILMLAMRKASEGTQLEKAQVSRLRETMVKVAARVRVSARKIVVELPRSCPFADEISMVAERLCNKNRLIFH